MKCGGVSGELIAVSPRALYNRGEGGTGFRERCETEGVNGVVSLETL